MRFPMRGIALLAGLTMLTYSCSSDDHSTSIVEVPMVPIEPSEPAPILLVKDNYETQRSSIIQIEPDLSKFTSPKVVWRLIEGDNKGEEIAKYSVSSQVAPGVGTLLSEETVLDFIVLNTGEYRIHVEVKDAKLVAEQVFTIDVVKEKQTYKTHIAKVFDFMPSYGQFTNKLPVTNVGDTKETIIAKVEKELAKPKAGMISLGGFGGYVVFGFDHTIVNVEGERDFKVLGNAFYAAANPNPDAPKGGSVEPGVIMVAYDKNKNGMPDEDEWYEIEGSAHNHKETIKNYEITYFKPSPELDEQKGNIDEYIRWEDNQGNKGWKPKNQFHAQSYYPLLANGDKVTFKGTRLPNNAVDESGTGTYWVLYAFEYGYADNAPNDSDDSSIDISWAIDKDGNKVHLPGIDFVKVYNGINQEAGWLGETSTEITGAVDLHLERIYKEENNK